MKTLVIFGSARENGHTKDMLDIFMQDSEGETEIIDAYRTKVSPCIDCRFCWKERGCSINDTMQDIYKKVDLADNIVLAAPMYFHSVPGPMKVLLDRFQLYWAGAVRNDRPEDFTKKGAILMVGGAREFENQFLAGEIVLKGLLHAFSAQCMGVVTFSDTDREFVNEDTKLKLKELAKKIF